MPLKKSVLSTSLLFVIVQTFFSGCAKNDDKQISQVVDEDLSAYAEASCRYHYNEGPMALQKAQTDLRSTYFGKKIDFSLLKPVLASSGSEVVRFAEMTGVRYYKTSGRRTDSCGFVEALPSAPQDISDYFSGISTDGSILGLYLGKNSPELPSTKDQGAITVRTDANKWVLVHEYMHHLFQIQTVADGFDVVVTKKKIKPLTDAIIAFEVSMKNSFGAERMRKVTEESARFVELNGAIQFLLKQYLLEEMTIETILGEKLEKSVLQLVHPKQRINGAAYILMSAKKSKKIIEDYTDMTNAFLRDHNDDIQASDRALINESLNKYAPMTTEMDALSYQARQFLHAQGLEFKGLGAANIALALEGYPSSSNGCSHGEVPEEILQSITQLKSKNR